MQNQRNIDCKLIKIESPELEDLGWPCGEMGCWTDSKWELTIHILDMQFVLPVCEKHSDLIRPEL